MAKIITNTLLAVNILIGTYSVFNENTLYGLVYILLLLFSAYIMVYSYCAKCTSCIGKCAHPQFGYLRKFVPKRITGAYKFFDYPGVALFVITAILLPQYFLWSNKWLFVLYWVLAAVMGICITAILCARCENKFCKMNRNCTQL